ncbi:phosphoadenosine phosphosulfate reductase family protein [Azospirillum sp. B506]|uniref:phosphoadenosine phosphosulfate reductase domain-containing protein n=1 Tax=Azospirillum sp. B506 TaxID=137721 RepID=UPI0003467789|nr:phosphoadenosine phosphosulfate reductase family protein [Azospirillum sp. B506]
MTDASMHNLVTEATAAIGRMIEGHQRIILQYSGGKDSTAMLYLARPFLDRIDVVFANAGAPYPHVLQFITSTCAQLGAKLTIIGSTSRWTTITPAPASRPTSSRIGPDQTRLG